MTQSLQAIFEGEGEARAAARAVDWANTAVGALDGWPISLRTTLGTLLNSRHPMFLWWGPELIQFYNDAYRPSFGRGKHPAAMGQRGADCWAEIWPIIFPQIEDVMARGKASWNEDQLVPIFRNGRIEEVYWTYGYSPVFDDAGAVGGVLVVCTETTAAVLAMRRLELSRRLGSALNGAQDSAALARITATTLAGASLDIPFAVVQVDAVEEVVGVAAADVEALRATVDATASFARPRLDHGVVCAPWAEPVSEAVVLTVDGFPGGTLTLGLSPRLPFDDSYAGFMQQIAEQLGSAQNRIGIELERRRLLLQAPVATALLTGPDHLYEIANPSYVEMVGREVLGKTYVEAFPEVVGTELLAIVHGVYVRGEPFATEEMQVMLAGHSGSELQEHYFKFNLEPIRDVRGDVYGMMVVAVDITSQVLGRRLLERSNQERSRLLEAAEVASRAKDEFLAMLGHELRNPLAPILTALELMKAKNLASVEKERNVIERQARHLVHLVDDLLDVSRVVAGKIELKKRRIALADVVTAAIETASPLFETQRHELRVDVAPHGLELDADPVRLAQVVANLLTNAARYTDPGGEVIVTARAVDGRAVLRVQDNGQGIAEQYLPYLFDRFFQATRTEHRAQGGLGLGLALVKGLVELHGGAVRVESGGLGKGSVFELSLPLALSAAAPALADSPSAPTAATAERVLLVDDNEDITTLFAELLRLEGYDVLTAHDGPSALRVAANFRPTVAVLDLGLPVMNGYEIASALIELCGPAVPRLIAMSGYGRRDDLERTREAGFEKHLVKPVDSTRLLNAITKR